MRWLKPFCLMIMVFSVAVAKNAPEPQISIVITKPVDAAMADDPQSRWGVALIDRFVRFRLEPLKGIKVISEEQMGKWIPSMGRIEGVVSDAQYESVAEKGRATHFLNQKFEYSQREKTLFYYVEVVRRSDRQVVASSDRSIPAEKIYSGIDSSLVSVLNHLKVERSQQVNRFFQIPVVGKNFKLIKQLGDVLLKEKSGSSPGDAVLGKEYEKIIQKDPLMLLANYSCGQAFFRAGKYDKSAKYLKELLDLIPMHSDLFLMLTKSYRLSGRYEDALNVIAGYERNQKLDVEFLVERALAYEGAGHDSYAFKVHTQVLALNPKQSQSLHFMARQKNKASRFKEAFEYANKMVVSDPGNGYGYFERGKSFLGGKQEQKALADLEKAAKMLPDDASVQELLADLYLKKQLYKEAVTHFRNALRTNQNDLELYLKTATALESNKNVTEALNLLTGISVKFSGNAMLYKATGLLQFKTGNLNDAIVNLEKYVKAYPNDGEVFRTLGNIYSLKSDFSRAVDAYKMAMPLLKEKNVCRMPIAEIYIQQKNYSAARKMLNEILAEKPGKGAHLMMGEVLTHQGELKSALSHLEKERSLHGNSVVVQEKIAQLYFKQNFQFPAKTEFTKLINLSPSHPTAYYYLAVLSLREKNRATAENFLKKAAALGPGDAAIYEQIGDAYLKMGVGNKAVESFEKALSFNGKNVEILLKLTSVYEKEDNDSMAAESCIRLFNVDNTKHSGYLAQAGHLFRKIKMDKKAADAYSLFLSRGFKDFNVNSNYAMIMYESKDYKKVISLLKMAGISMLQNGNVLMILADSYCKEGRYEDAIPLLSKLLASGQESREVMELSAVAYEKTGDTLSAISFYERFLRFPLQDKDAGILYHLGELYESKKMDSKAIARYEANIKEIPDDLRNHWQLGNLYISSKQWEKARIILEKAVEFPHAKIEFKKLLARTYTALNEPERAADFYHKYLKSSGSDAIAWKELGTIYYSRKMYSQAIKPLDRAVELLPDDFESLYMLGISLVESEEYSKAISPLGRARAIKKTDTGILELTALCYRKLNQNSSLMDFLREWIKIDPKRYDIKIELGSLMLQEKKVSDAIKMLKEAAKFVPSDVRPRLLLAEAYEVSGNDSLRLFELKNALKFAPQEWEAHYQTGRYYMSKGAHREAEQHLARAVDLHQGHAGARFDYGSLLLELGKPAASLAQLNSALEKEPNNARYLATAAYALCLTGNQKRGLQNISVALGKSTSDAQVLYWAGRVYYQVGKKEQARQGFDDALSIDPSFAPCFEALGDISMEELKFKDAARNYFRSWEKGGYNERRAFKLGSALTYDRKFVEARDFYEAVVKRNPGFSEAVYRLVEVHCELKELEKARALLKNFKKDGSPWMQLAQGKIYETENNTEAAMVAYTIAGRIDPENPHYLAGLGHTYLKQKKTQEAIEALSMASASDQLNMQLLIDLGRAFQGSGDSESAFLYYQEVEKRCPEHPDVYKLMADVKSEQKMHRDAAKICERGLKYHPDDPDLLYKLGLELELAGEYESAVKAFQNALKKGKGAPVEALRHIGNIYYVKIVNSKNAREFFKRYVRAGGESPEVSEAMKKLEGI